MTDSLTSDIAPRPDDNPIRSAFGPAGQADTVLQEHDATFRALFENIDEAFALCELVRDDAGRPVDYRILDVNHALEVASRLPRASMVGRLRSQILDTPDPEAFEYFARVVETGKPLQYDNYSIAIDRWVENLVSPQGGDRFAMLLKDITERKLADTALRASEERQTFLVGLSDALRPLRDPIELQRTACRLLGEHLGADRVHYSERHPDEGYVLVSTDYCRTGLTSMAGRYPLAAFSEIPAGLGGGNSVVVADTGDPRLLGDRASAAFRALGIRAFIAAQLICDTKVVWTLSVAATSLREWLPAEVALVEKVLENTWDAVERARAEAALRESEERLRLAAAATGLIMFDWDLTTDRATVNPRYREMLGLSEDEEVRGQAVLGGIVHPADRASVMTQLAAAFDPRSDGGFRLEHRALTPNGDRTMLAIGEVYFTGEGADRCAVRVIGTELDITERAVIEAALRAEHARLQAIIDTIPVGFVFFEPSGKASMANEETERIWRGRLSINAFGDSKGYWPETGRPLAPEDWPAAQAVLYGQTTLGLEVDIERLDGSQGTILISAAPIKGPDGTTIGAVSATQDISERKQAEVARRESEERFRAVANLVPDLLWSTPQGGRTDWYNQRWLDYTGQTLEEALAGGWGASIHPDDRTNMHAKIRVARASGEPIRQELRIRSADGSYRWALVRAAPVRDAGGVVNHWFGAASDIHDERVARDELTGRVREATADLQRLSRRLLMVQEEERRHLARELHDEIGQALTGLQLQLAAARAAASAASGSVDLRQTRRGLMEAEQIVQELTVRVSELSMDLRPSALDSLGLLPALLMHVDRYQARTGLRIDLRHEGLDRRFAQEVETAAYRAVQEALTNIVRHARATHATVRLLADDQTLVLAIRDDGLGFDPAAQADTGGLSGMRERVELLGGTVIVEAAPGQGTLVTAELPLDAGGTGPLSTGLVSTDR